MAGVMHPEIIGIDEEGFGMTWANHGKGAPNGSVGSRYKVAVSISVILAITSGENVTRSPVASFLMMERSVGREGES